MKHRALIVDDDPDIAESVAETLDSLGHEHVWVKSQEEARQQIADGGFTYVLLDLQIPVRFGRGLACIEYGEHLAREMCQSPTMHGIPIIVMTAYGKEGLEIAAPLCEHGVIDFINKPFPRTGRTLASLIHSVLERTCRKREGAGHEHLKPEKPFQGGELVFHKDRVELCGVTVVSAGRSCQMWTILEALTQRLDERRYKALPGSALAVLVDGFGGQGSVAGSVRDFRRHVAEQLGRELGLKVQPDDVIETAKAGYRLNARIVVRDLRNTRTDPLKNARPNGSHERANAGSGERVTRADGRANTGSRERVDAEPDDPANEKREQILALIRSGARLRVPGFAERLRCSYATAKRDVDALKAEGRIEFVGPTKTGYYALAESAPV